MRVLRLYLPLVPLAALLFAAPSSVAEVDTSRVFARGMVISCPRAGQIWGSSHMAVALQELNTVGVNWIAIHPYAWVERNGAVNWRPAATTGYLERATVLSKDAEMRLFWKPHLGYWGSFRWRGDIGFGDDDDAWRRFFDGYRKFIVDQARFAQASGAEILAVGVEYDQTMQHESEWRRIIQDVRGVYHGAITYAANWDQLDRVPFWDALDLIGVHAYFPLADEKDPDRESLARGWDQPLAQLAMLSKEFRKPVVFAEIGYNRSASAASEPWDFDVEDSPAHRALRQRLMEVAIQRAEAAPFVRGMFWWKWMPGPTHHRRNFSMRDPEALAVLRQTWSPTRAR